MEHVLVIGLAASILELEMSDVYFCIPFKSSPQIFLVFFTMRIVLSMHFAAFRKSPTNYVKGQP
jgi:hypothetical protein